MPSHEHLAEVIREWVEKAENDLKNASHTLKLGKECPVDTVCFHAQQCVEKYLKGVLILRSIPFPKTHDIEALYALLPPSARPHLSQMDQKQLTRYVTAMRYPGDYLPITLAEARSSVVLARRIRKEIRAILPRAALRPRRIGRV